MTKYQIDLMAVIRYNNPELTIAELETRAMELHAEIKAALDANREIGNKK